MHNLPDFFQAYATGETQTVVLSTEMMTASFTILSNSALTLGHMEIGHFCRHGWQVGHCHVA